MIDLASIERISRDSSKIRNFCLLAHVDHGKTTLGDFLIASNGVMSTALAGTVRFLDSRPDEQVRLITMKASSIALSHTESRSHEEHLLNLVDAPGHIDFSSEVSTAIRICDGAIIVVDAVDGVTAQTIQLLREAFINKLSMMLVINKMDLLITRLQLTAADAHYKLRTIIECCNAALAAYVNQLSISGAVNLAEYVFPEDNLWFAPAAGNVIFASCLDKWAFSVADLALLYAEKLSMDVADLVDGLWGEKYLDAKHRAVVSKPTRASQEPMAVQLLLSPIWDVYKVFEQGAEDLERASKISAKLGIPERRWKCGKDPRMQLQLLMGEWLPLARVVMDTVCTALASPKDAQGLRLPSFLPDIGKVPDERLMRALRTCDGSADVPAVVFVSKLIDVNALAGQLCVTDEGGGAAAGSPQAEDAFFQQSFIGFARVFCGTLRVGEEVVVQSAGRRYTHTLGQLFILRGRGLEPVAQVSAGCICGIAGVAAEIVKHGTLSTEPSVPPFTPIDLMSSSIVRVSVAPEIPSELPQMLRGLQLLNQVDAQVQLSVLPTGQHVLCCAGEVHLDRCIKDLTETFAKVRLRVSDPIHHFRETIVAGPRRAPPVQCVAGEVTVWVSVQPLPEWCGELLNDDHRNHMSTAFTAQLVAQVGNSSEWALPRHVADFGPRKFSYCGALLLLDESVATRLGEIGPIIDAIKSGFQIGIATGSLAEEPLHSVAVVVHGVDGDSVGFSTTTPGGLMIAVRDGIKASMEQQPRRLVEPVFHCTVFSSGATQGKVYASLSRRRAQIIEEVPNEGSDLFHVACFLPVVESFGLQDDLRIATHGAATAQLRIDHWAVIDSDPHFTPTTRDEIEDFGTVFTMQNMAAKLLEKIRRRKGIHKENIVEAAEKQKFSIRGA